MAKLNHANDYSDYLCILLYKYILPPIGSSLSQLFSSPLPPRHRRRASAMDPAKELMVMGVVLYRLNHIADDAPGPKHLLL